MKDIKKIVDYFSNSLTQNIIILTSSDFPYHGAAENFVRQMALGLQQNGANVEVIRYWGDRYHHNNDTTIELSNYLFEKPIKNEFLKFFELAAKIVYLPWFINYCKRVKKCNAIFIYGLDSSTFLLPILIWCKIFNLKIYRVITEIYPVHTYVNSWWRIPDIVFRKWQNKYFDRFLTGIVVLSTVLRDLLLACHVDSSNILLIPHFIQMDVQLKKKNDHIFRIGFCGSSIIENGIIDLIDAFFIVSKLVPEAELLIIGEILPDVKKIIHKKIYGNTKIVVTGRVDPVTVKEHLAMCSVLVNPRRSGVSADTGFPTKVGEYLATQKPVINTYCGDISLYLTDKKEIFFSNPNSPTSLADVIIFVFENKALSNQVGIGGYKWALKNLEYIENSKKLLSFIVKL
jgi:glycosyltransferase involved in cell wall biosynthesis